MGMDEKTYTRRWLVPDLDAQRQRGTDESALSNELRAALDAVCNEPRFAALFPYGVM